MRNNKLFEKDRKIVSRCFDDLGKHNLALYMNDLDSIKLIKAFAKLAYELAAVKNRHDVMDRIINGHLLEG